MDLNPESQTLPLDTLKMLAGVAAIPLVIFGGFLFVMYRTNYNRKERFDCCLIACVGFLLYSISATSPSRILNINILYEGGVLCACALGTTIYMFRHRKHPEIQSPRIMVMYILMLCAFFAIFNILYMLLGYSVEASYL
ncbi:MAG: hypothetical protein ACJAR1_001892 [Rubritalea sp.]|jgi:hypothetical protein